MKNIKVLSLLAALLAFLLVLQPACMGQADIDWFSGVEDFKDKVSDTKIGTNKEDKPDGTICGDGVLDTFNYEEECDDGNTVSGDGCNENCYLESEKKDKYETNDTFATATEIPTDNTIQIHYYHPRYDIDYIKFFVEDLSYTYIISTSNILEYYEVFDANNNLYLSFKSYEDDTNIDSRYFQEYDNTLFLNTGFYYIKLWGYTDHLDYSVYHDISIKKVKRKKYTLSTYTCSSSNFEIQYISLLNNKNNKHCNDTGDCYCTKSDIFNQCNFENWTFTSGETYYIKFDNFYSYAGCYYLIITEGTPPTVGPSDKIDDTDDYFPTKESADLAGDLPLETETIHYLDASAEYEWFRFTIP